MVGCGNAKFSEDLHEDNYKNITNVDWSSTVIEQMKDKYKEKCPEMSYEVIDCRNMNDPKNF